MSTAWKAARHPDDCNSSIHGCHCARKDVKLQVRSLVFPSLQQDELLLVISSGENQLKYGIIREGRETNSKIYSIVQEAVYPSRQDPIIGQTDERVVGI